MNKLNNILKSSLLSVVLLGSLASRALCGSSTVAEWQSRFEAQVQTIVKMITGSPAVWVLTRVDAVLAPDLEQVGQPIQAGSLGREILPGVNSDEVSAHLVRGSSVSTERPIRIKSVKVTVILPASVNARQIQILNDRLPGLLGLDLGPGKDTLDIQQVPVVSAWVLAWHTFTRWIVRLFLIALAAAILIGLAALFKPGIRLISQRKSEEELSMMQKPEDVADEEKNKGEHRLLPSPESLPLGLGRNGQDALPSAFAFLKDVKVENIGFLLSLEPTELACYVISHVSPDLAVGILDAMPPEAREEALKELTSMSVQQPAEVEALATRLAERAQHVSGGTSLLVDIFDQMDLETQENYLAFLGKNNPQAARAIRQGLIKIDDVFKLKPALFKQVLGEAYRTGVNLACLLRSRSAEDQQKAIANMPPTLQRIVEEDLQADVSDAREPERLEEATRHLLHAAKRVLMPTSKIHHIKEEVC